LGSCPALAALQWSSYCRDDPHSCCFPTVSELLRGLEKKVEELRK
jgi:hypothetical protein